MEDIYCQAPGDALRAAEEQLQAACAAHYFYEGNPMPEITGRQLAELHPNGTLLMVFIAHTGSGNGS